ncbi:MAG: hypothetical protein H5U03_08920 [Clostridia bacterium]|nr:hypothetical protein [Clostridia bacterium]
MDAVQTRVRRAIEIDLEEIRLLTEAAALATDLGVRHKLLHFIVDEVLEAMFWNHHLGHVLYRVGRPRYEDPYSYGEKQEQK